MLKGRMSCKDGVIRLHDRGCGLRGRVNAEFQLALLAVVNGQTLHEECTKARSGSTTKRVEDKETLQSRAIICYTTNLVQDLINKFFADSVVATSIVVGGIFFTSNHVLWVEKASIGAGTDLVYDIGLKVAINGSRYIFALTYDTKE